MTKQQLGIINVIGIPITILFFGINFYYSVEAAFANFGGRYNEEFMALTNTANYWNLFFVAFFILSAHFNKKLVNTKTTKNYSFVFYTISGLITILSLLAFLSYESFGITNTGALNLFLTPIFLVGFIVFLIQMNRN